MKLHRRLLGIFSRLVPKELREEWRAEWDAELHQRERRAAGWERRGHAGLVRHSAGAFWDALWLQSNQWYSLRLFARHWRLALTAVLSQGGAIAVTVIGLSAYNALLLRPPGVGDPDRLRLIHMRASDDPYGAASYPEYQAFRDRSRAFSDIAAYPHSVSSVALIAGTFQSQVTTTPVSENFFRVTDVTPVAGVLAFSSSSAPAGVEIAIGAKLWRRLGQDPKLIGSTVLLNGHSASIVGVVPDSFGGMTWGFAPDVWLSLRGQTTLDGGDLSALADPTRRTLHMIGRLAPSTTDAQATTEVRLVADAIARDRPGADRDRSAGLSTVSVTPPGDRAWASTLLGGLVFIVLLTLVVACANVTNLLLGLSASRRHEMLVRAALGGSRLQLALPIVREGVMLGLAAGVLGAGAAWAILANTAAFTPSLGPFFPTLSLDLHPDWRVFAATTAIALAAGVAVGLVPAWRSASDGLSGALHREFDTGDRRRARLRHALVIVQMSIASLVLVALGVSAHSLVRLSRAPLGFSARHLVYTGVDATRSGHDAATGLAFYDRVRDAVLAAPGVEAVTLASDPPLLGYWSQRALPDGAAPVANDPTETPYIVVHPSYFETIGMPILRGRAFDSRDRAGTTRVAVVNATLADRWWPGRDAVGQRIRLGDDRHLVEVIGVAPAGKYGDVEEETRLFIYLPLAQEYTGTLTVIARTHGTRDTILRAIGTQPGIAFGGIGPIALADLLEVSTLLPRTIVWTTIVFAGLALGLATFGLYSTVFYAVSQRRREIGIRTALGATPRDLLRLVLRDSGWVALLGAGVGVFAGLLLLPVAASIFYGIEGTEPAVLIAVSLLCAGITVATSYVVVRPWTRAAALELLRR